MVTRNYFCLHSNCIPVKGAIRSIVCDLQRNIFHFIPNGLCEILLNQNFASIQEIKNKFNNEEDIVIDEYFTFLIQNDLGFFCDKKELNLFPKMSLFWDEPFRISNVIIDTDLESTHDYKKIFLELEGLGCGHIQLRFFSNYDLKAIKSFLEFLKNTTIKSFELILKYSLELTSAVLEDLFRSSLRLRIVYIHSSPEFCLMKANSSEIDNILFVKDAIDSASHCGIVNPTYFNFGISMFTESQTYNSCLNRKIGIDVFGNIKNCPSMNKSYGHHKDVSIGSVLNNEEFKFSWSINKSQIKICKDCEFRYVCTDCRAFIEDPNDSYSKPLKCGYDPHAGVWQEWSTNPLKQKAIENYEKAGLLSTK